ncbi:hypothetical protein B9J75_04470 [Leuconostoc citreum]|uniref:WxL domain-containing protein n=1 Tax=Leuconostoc citreum TaxID=33964 RepID=UPI000A200BCC|nr:WxL domain-containing protein [Leuconostoc citreum]OSP81910.1 hypothetical protein B9J75_04470 [Leuconostoc citreum]
MKKYILKLAIVIIFLCPIGTVSAYDKLPLKNGGSWQEDFSNITTDSTNAMNIAQPFLLFTRNLNINGGQMLDGNIATQNLNTYGSFLNGKTGISYVQNSITNTASWLHINQASKFVFGSSFKIVRANNAMQIEAGPSNLKQLVNNVSQSQLYQDTESHKYLDFDRGFAQLDSNAKTIITQASRISKPIITEDPWYWPRITIDTSNVATAANGTKIISLSARDLDYRRTVILKGLGKAEKIIFAINTDGVSQIDLQSIRFGNENEWRDVQLPMMFTFSNTSSAYTGGLRIGMNDSFTTPVRSILAPQAAVDILGDFHGSIASDTVNYHWGKLRADQGVLFPVDNLPEEGSLSWVTNTFGVSFGTLKSVNNHFEDGGALSEQLRNINGDFSGIMQVKDTRNLSSTVKLPFYLTLSWTQPFTTNEMQNQLTRTSIDIPAKLGSNAGSLKLEPGETIQVPSNGSANAKDVYMFKVKNDTTSGIKTLYSQGKENKFAFDKWQLNIGAQDSQLNMGTYTAGFTWTLSPSRLTNRINP